MSGEKIWLVGAGAIGSILAGRLHSDPPCRLIDGWREHTQAIRTDGLQVDYQDEITRVTLPAFHLSELGDMQEKSDLILLAVKSDATVDWMNQLLPHMSDRTLVVSLQNGINEETIVGLRRNTGRPLEPRLESHLAISSNSTSSR
jgi:2-dehydropantoate 2-reductase